MTAFSQSKPKMTEKISKTKQLDTYNFTRLHIGSLHRKEKNKIQKDSIHISGLILDEMNLPLPGTTIKIKNSSTEKSTDFDGNFSLRVRVKDTLIVSYVGYESQDVKISANKTTYKITLKPGEPLEEVLVVAGYAVERKHLGGAAIAVHGDDIATITEEDNKTIIHALKESLKKFKKKTKKKKE